MFTIGILQHRTSASHAEPLRAGAASFRRLLGRVPIRPLALLAGVSREDEIPPSVQNVRTVSPPPFSGGFICSSQNVDSLKGINGVPGLSGELAAD